MTIRIFFILILIISSDLLLPQNISPEYFEKNGEIYFSFQINSLSELKLLTNLISIDNVSGNRVFAYANEYEFGNFLKQQYSYEILPKPGLNEFVKMSSELEEINDWDTYPTYEGYINMMYQFQADYPGICEIVDAGNSVQGRKILFAKISDNINNRENEPQLMYTSTMHGDETTGYVLMLRLIDSLLVSYGSDERVTNMVNETEIWINPLANPDGTYYGGNHTVNGATRYNANGFDLNRNFPDPGLGIHPNEQPETIVFRQIAESNNFVLSANFHGGAEVVNYPWDTWPWLHADDDWFRFISHLYADTAQQYSPPNYMNGFDDGITNGYAWYEVNHGRQDYMTYFRHGREVTIELSDVKLLNPALLPAHWEYNKRSLLTFIENSLFGVRGTVTNIYGEPIFATISIPGHDIDNSEVWADSINGNFHRMISPGLYTLEISSPGYITAIISNVLVELFTTTFVDVQLTPISIPVELTSFTADLSENMCLLSWHTASETNNAGFEVERRTFEYQKQRLTSIQSGSREFGWESIGFIAGNGTSSEPKSYLFTDDLHSIPDVTFIVQYRLKQIDFDGTFNYSDLIEIEINQPDELKLEQNYPNPFNPSTKIKYTVPVKLNSSEEIHSGKTGSVEVNLIVYDILGREVVSLVQEEQSPGNYEVEFNSNMLNSVLSGGVYFYRLIIGSQSVTRKMLLLP